MPANTVDAGVYNYRLNGGATAVREYWQRSRQPSGDWLISSSRTAPGVEIAVEAQVTEGRVMSFEIAWRAAGQYEQLWEYRLAPDRVVVECVAGDAPSYCEELSFPAAGTAPLLFPLMRSGMRIVRIEGAILLAVFVAYTTTLMVGR